MGIITPPAIATLKRLGIWNVLDFGADSTGVAYSDTAFAAAQTTVAAVGGGTIRVPCGTWNLLAQVTQTVGVNWEVEAGATFPSGQLNAYVFQPQYGIYKTTATQHPTSNTHYTYQFATVDNCVGGETGVQEAVRVNITTLGNNVTLGTGSHDVGIQVESTCGLTGTSYQQLLVPIEGVASVLNSGVTLNNAYTIYSKLVGNAGTISNYFGFYDTVSNAGTITNLYHYFVQVPTNTGTIGTEYAFYNNSTNAIICNIGLYWNSTHQELVPYPGTSYVTTGRFQYGVNRGAVSGSVTPGTGQLFCPWMQAGRTTVSKIAVNITTAVAAATVQVALYSPYHGTPGSVVAGPWTLSAATAGLVTASISSLTLDGGLYFFGIIASSPTVAVSAYVENAAGQIWGSSTITGADCTPTSTSNTIGTSPPLTYIANGSVMPLIAMTK